MVNDMNFEIFFTIFGLFLLLAYFYPRKIFSRFPFLEKVSTLLILPNVIIHEFFHAFVSMMTFGKVKGIKLFHNGSGLAVSATGSKISRLLTILAGYTGASLYSFLSVYLLSLEKVDYVFYSFVGICIFTLLYIRNFFGFLYMLFLNVAWLLFTFTEYENFKDYFVFYLVTVFVIHSFSSAITILKLSFKNKNEAGDATSMRDITFIPTLFWGFAFFVQATFWFFVNLNLIFNLYFF